MNLLVIYVASIIGSTTIMFVEDSLSWGIGFRICVALTAEGLGMMIARMRFYRRTKAWGSAFTEPESGGRRREEEEDASISG
ncbi:hypothetical protein KSP39_PZI010730 [Platanthera zijinensis]|uniref:Uncharacterized protein n=1 Tax=Platanthera zijinensis TaxID=2320716 RepID=A0AAP0G6S1_9ASPA